MCRALWSLVTQTPPETPWATCPRWAVRAPCLAAGVAVQAEGLLLGSVHHSEAESLVLSGAHYTPACRGYGMYRWCVFILGHLCRASDKVLMAKGGQSRVSRSPKVLGTPVGHSWHATWPIGKLLINEWQEPSHPLSLSLLESMCVGLSYQFLFYCLFQRLVERDCFSTVSEETWPSPVGFHFSQ